MKQQQPDKKTIPAKDIVLRILVYGIPITIGILGFVLGWWEKIAKGG